MPEQDITYHRSLEIVLGNSEEPLSLPEIIRQIINRQLRKEVVSSSLRSVLNKDFKLKQKSNFIRVERGKYTLRQKRIDRSENLKKVLVIKSNYLREINVFHGIRENHDVFTKKLLSEPDPLFIDRDLAEENDNYKQIVSYVIIKYKNKLLRFTRHESKINKLLDYVDGKYSIGFGGHVQFADNFFSHLHGDSGYTESLRRELKEEAGIIITENSNIKLIGVLNDESTPLGKRHFAFIHLLEINESKIIALDEFVSDLEFVSFDKLSEDFVEFEYWSKICLQHFFDKQLKHKCFIGKKNKLSIIDNNEYLSIVGEIGSGKSHICSILENNFDYVVIPCSKILRDLIGDSTEFNTQRLDLQNTGLGFIESEGAHELFAKKLKDFAGKHANKSRFILDGLRYPKTHLEFQKIIKKSIPTIYVQNTVDMKYKLFSKREKNKLDMIDFLKILDHPVERQIKDFLPISNAIIYNLSPLESLSDELIKFFNKELVDVHVYKSWNSNAKLRHDQILRGNDFTYWQILIPNILNKLKEINNYSNLSVLDVGCGTGVLTGKISNLVEKVVALDISYESILLTKETTKGKNISYTCIGIQDYYPEKQFDVVIANMTLHSVYSLKPALKSIFNCLKDGGRFIYSIPHPKYYPQRKRLKDVFLKDGYEYEKDSYHIIPFSISAEPTPLPTPIPYFHRSLEKYTSVFEEIGLHITEQIAPMPEGALLSKYPKKWEYPHVLIGVAEKNNNNQ